MPTAQQKELTLQKIVSLPAAVVSRSALDIDPRATDRQLADLGKSLISIEGSRSWWIGDYGLFLQRRRLEQLKKGADGAPPVTDKEELEAKGLHYITGKADALGIDVGTWRNYVMVSRFYKPSHRDDEMSFGHHVVAIYAAGGAGGDPKKAISWLIRAKENGWTVSKMRETVNRALASNRAPALPPPENLFAPLDEADKWAHNMAEQPINPEAARELLTRFRELVAFVEKLKELAK